MDVVFSCLAGEPALCLFEASCEAAVVYSSAQLRHDAAEQGGVDFHGRDYFQVRDRFESADHACDFGVRRLNRKRKGRALTAHRLVYLIAIRLGDSTDLADASMARDHNCERANREAEVQPLGILGHLSLPRLIGQLRRREALEQFGRLDYRGQPFELGAPLLLVAAICEIEQGARVALGDARTFHRGAPVPSFSMKPSISPPS